MKLNETTSFKHWYLAYYLLTFQLPTSHSPGKKAKDIVFIYLSQNLQ